MLEILKRSSHIREFTSYIHPNKTDPSNIILAALVSQSHHWHFQRHSNFVRRSCCFWLLYLGLLLLQQLLAAVELQQLLPEVQQLAGLHHHTQITSPFFVWNVLLRRKQTTNMMLIQQRKPMLMHMSMVTVVSGQSGIGDLNPGFLFFHLDPRI